nr:ATP-binding protein [Aestuariibacter sp. A3R04]
MGDGYFIERAIENIVLNAVRHAHSKVLLSAEQSKGFVVIHVEDDGPGVAPQDAEKIFTPFFRPDSARSRERGGAGLGLAIVKRIQSWHHGYCSVTKSKLGGANFSISYPTRT